MIYSVFIDLDYAYNNLKDQNFLIFLRENIKKAKDYLRNENYICKKIYIRKSANNHIHLRLDVAIPIFNYTFDKKAIDKIFFVDMLIFRAILKDDPFRVSLDLQRFSRNKDLRETNRIFDRKTENYKTKKAGKWKDINDILKSD